MRQLAQLVYSDKGFRASLRYILYITKGFTAVLQYQLLVMEFDIITGFETCRTLHRGATLQILRFSILSNGETRFPSLARLTEFGGRVLSILSWFDLPTGEVNDTTMLPTHCTDTCNGLDTVRFLLTSVRRALIRGACEFPEIHGSDSVICYLLLYGTK